MTSSNVNVVSIIMMCDLAFSYIRDYSDHIPSMEKKILLVYFLHMGVPTIPLVVLFTYIKRILVSVVGSKTLYSFGGGGMKTLMRVL